MASRTLIPFLAPTLFFFVTQPLLAAAGREPFAAVSQTNAGDREWAEEAAKILQQLPPPLKHYVNVSQGDADKLLRQDSNYLQAVREKLAGRWFAALIGTSEESSFAVQGRFDTWRGLVEFLAERNALVEVWAWGEGIEGASRRLPAS